MSLDIIMDWYKGLPKGARERMSLAHLHDLSKRLSQRHDFWGAGEPDCPREIKAGNGELHTLRCKRCGLDSPRDDICRPDVIAAMKADIAHHQGQGGGGE